ncbi:MAG: hypothetical protein LBT59_15025 [Clostridiales bacterium]|jgi:DNA segregation ATPase FtsK/SpoIIIE-like protein|nr:hypothetical protein [Clostridiales bacterium]
MGSGKTILLLSAALALCEKLGPEDLRICLSKGSDFFQLAELPQIMGGVMLEAEEIEQTTRRAHSVMMFRRGRMAAGGR